MDNLNNEIVEINSDDAIEMLNNSIPVEHENEIIIEKELENKNNRNFFKGRKKLIIILSSILLVLIIILILSLTLFKKDKKTTPSEEAVVLEKDNYRYENGKLLFLDKSDKVIGEYKCINEDPDKCMVMKNDYSQDQFERVKSVYEDGTEITKFSLIYDDNYVFVTDGKESYLYNIKDAKKELKVNNIKTYGTEKNIIVIEDEDNKYGVIEIGSDGFDYLIRPSYNYLGIINTKSLLIVAKDKDKTYLIDSDGKKISENISGLINSANDQYIVVLKNESYNLYNYKNEEVLSNYNYIGLYDDVIALVDSGRLFLRDNELNKLNEDGFRLKNSYYEKQYVYDKDNKLKETNKAFEIVSKDNSIMVTIDDEIKNVNVLEGYISSKFNYMSYFDGKLYFYNDEEKDNLLGTYTCNNKNNITSKESTLDKCNILTNMNGYTGIYNNNIVIINDNYGNSETKYTIYSLKEKKVKGTYSNIEIINVDEINDNIEHIGTTLSYLIAQTDTGNNKGNYGILEINSEKIIGKKGIEFSYKEIKKEGSYYLFTNLQNMYILYSNTFDKISGDLAYIKLYDKYYVGIKDNKLNLYTYIGNKVLENDLDITDTNYTISFENEITITINGEEFKYTNTGKLVVPEENEENNEENNNEED